MNQILFYLPLHTPWTPDGVPVPGFGVMLFLAFVIGNYLIGKRAERAGMPKEPVQDVALWIFLTGIVGARILFMIQYRDQFKNPLVEFFQIWRGGIVFYGSAVGGTLGYLLARQFIVKRFNLSTWKIADVVAPSIVAGLCLGRVGCLLNGCCYGHIAAPDHVAVRFPMLTAPVQDLLVRGQAYQTLTGFGVGDDPGQDTTVVAVEPGSTAQAAGLEVGDEIAAVDGRPVTGFVELSGAIYDRPRGQGDVQLDVRRGGKIVSLPAFTPRTVGIIPTQLFESTSMVLLFFVLISLYPLRRFDGQVFFVMMMCYAVHRFFNEMLRDDTTPVAFNMTISQNISIVIFTLGAFLYAVVGRSSASPAAPKA